MKIEWIVCVCLCLDDRNGKFILVNNKKKIEKVEEPLDEGPLGS